MIVIRDYVNPWSSYRTKLYVINPLMVYRPAWIILSFACHFFRIAECDNKWISIGWNQDLYKNDSA